MLARGFFRGANAMGSNLFNLAASAAKKALRHPTLKHAARELQRTLERHEQGRATPREIDRAVKRFNRDSNQSDVNEFDVRGGIGKHGFTSKDARALQSSIRQMGQLGTIIDTFLNRRTEGMNRHELEAAAELLREQRESTSDRKYRETMERAVRNLDRSLIRTPKRQTRTERKTKAGRQFKDMSKVYRTPRSSNVYSFQYDFTTKTLYVRFKAPLINSRAVSNYRGSGGMTNMAGDLGKTLTGKTNDPGTLYAYFNVPKRVFKRCISNSSAGKAVWDNLRQRGSIWGHQYRYSLVESATVPGENGQPANYVPRRATHRGFRSRSVAVRGTGKRDYASSTLPEDTRGHSALSRGTVPSNGRPRGPNRG